MQHKSVKRHADWLAELPSASPMTHEATLEIAEALEASPAVVLGCKLIGGDNPTGLRLSLAYEGDDVSVCGNDILFWLRWRSAHGTGDGRPPRMVFDSVGELPELIRLDLDFGFVGHEATAGFDEISVYRPRVVE